MRRKKIKMGIGKRIISGLLALTLMVTSVNMPVNIKDAKAAEKTAALKMSNLANKSGIKIPTDDGTHTKISPYHKMKIDVQEGFCMDLGKVARSNDTYKLSSSNENKKYSTSGGTKEAWMARVGMWYCDGSTSIKGTKKWKCTQVMVWTIESNKKPSEGDIKSALKNVVSDGTAGKIIDNLKARTGEVTCNIWTSTNANRQKILDFKKSDTPDPDWDIMFDAKTWYQNIRVVKKDDEGNPLPDVKFTVLINGDANYISEWKLTDRDHNHEEQDLFDDIVNYKYEGYTDKNGEILFEFKIDRTTSDYVYVTPETKTAIDAIEKETDQDAMYDKIQKEIDGYYEDEEYGPSGDARTEMDEAQQMMEAELETPPQMDYDIVEDGRDDLLVNPAYQGTVYWSPETSDSYACWDVEYNPAFSGWISTEDESDYSTDANNPVTKTAEITNKYKKVKTTISKTDPYGNPSSGAKFKLYYDSSCTVPVIDQKTNQEVTITTGSNGKGEVIFFPDDKNYGSGEGENRIYTFYAKEVNAATRSKINTDTFKAENVQYTCKNPNGTAFVPMSGNAPQQPTDYIALSANIVKVDGNVFDTEKVRISGATYSLYEDQACTKPVTYNYPYYLPENEKNGHNSSDQVTMTTNANGLAQSDEFFPSGSMYREGTNSGNYVFTFYAKETKKSGMADEYDLNPEVYEVEVNAGGNGSFTKISDPAKEYGHVQLQIAKEDGNQVDGSLDSLYVGGATYTVYRDKECTQPVTYNYPGYIKNKDDYTSHTNDKNNYHNRSDIVTLKTKENGNLVQSGWFYPSNQDEFVIGDNGLPVYTYYIKETNRENKSRFYDLNPTVYKVNVTYNETSTIKENSIEENIVRDYGNVKINITKQDKETKNTLSGATFTLYEDAACTKPVKYNYPKYVNNNNYRNFVGDNYHNPNDTVTATSYDGIAQFDSFYPSNTAIVELGEDNLPYYTYYIKETYSPKYYFIEHNLDKVSIVHKTKKVTYTQNIDPEELLNGDSEYSSETLEAENYAIKGWAELFLFERFDIIYANNVINDDQVCFFMIK